MKCRATADTPRRGRISSAPPSPALAECAVNDVLGLEAAVKVRQKDAYLSLKLPAKLGQTAESTCQTLMTALMVHFAQLHEEYPDHIIVLEV